MICFPNAKINLGLNVVEKRNDGFHNIETVFYPIAWRDILEVLPTHKENGEFEISITGLEVHGDIKDNLIYKAWLLLNEVQKLPSIHVHLHKVIPMGAGLGGGSADAAFFINLINEMFEMNLNIETRTNMARKLGSDCAFFIENKPVYASQKGDVFSSVDINLQQYKIITIWPSVHSNTKEAYVGLIPKASEINGAEVLSKHPISQWQSLLTNDFEKSIFEKYPEVQKAKDFLLQQGALYACMSGSGSAVFGVFEATTKSIQLAEKNWLIFQD